MFQLLKRSLIVCRLEIILEGHISIIEKMKPYTISYSQKQAGFVVENTEEVMLVDIDPRTTDMIKKLKKIWLLWVRRKIY